MLTTASSTLEREQQQALLGDANSQRQLELASRQARADAILETLGPKGLAKPRDTLHFFTDVKFKKVSGQQLEAKCMFCKLGPMSSTGATRLVDHLVGCLLCPPSITEAVNKMRTKTQSKRKEREEMTSIVQEESALALQLEKVRNHID
ncbi:MAG: hypothetical protein SGPRY_013447 [Prymnesium sp.]